MFVSITKNESERERICANSSNEADLRSQFHQKNFVYVYKGILGRFAPIIVHFAMILILFGNTITAFGSFNSQELIAKGEIFQIQN